MEISFRRRGSLRRTLSGTTGAGFDPCAALRSVLTIAPGETLEVVILLGAATSQDEARAIIGRHSTPASARAAVAAAVSSWDARLTTISARTPSPEFDAMVNRWSLYQALACRMWARSALYQSSGAFGFRDQLQDCMAFVYAEPGIARAHLVRCAGRQFAEGDVQHWWHEPGGRGVRTRFSDDLVWLPFVADHYVTVTGDASVWDERAPYLEQRPLAPGEQEAYEEPHVSATTGTLYEHCVRALDRACTDRVARSAAHGMWRLERRHEPRGHRGSRRERVARVVPRRYAAEIRRARGSARGRRRCGAVPAAR